MSWHWEEVNYTSYASERLVQLCQAFEYITDDVTVQFRDVHVSGDASISLRRGRAIPTCGFTLSMQWLGITDRAETTASGSLSIADFDTETRGITDVSVQVKASNDDFLHHRLRRLLHDSVVPALLTALNEQFLQPFKSKDALDVLQRQQQRSQITTVDASTAGSVVATAPSSSSTSLAGSGSGGDHGGTGATADEPRCSSATKFATDREAPASSTDRERLSATEDAAAAPSNTLWNERTLTGTALQKLHDVVLRCNGNVKCLNGSCALEFFDVHVTGEAAATMKRQKQIVIFEFNLKASWRAVARTAGGVFMADAKGGLVVKNFNSEDIDELKVEFLCDDASHPARKRIYDAVKSECGPQLEQRLRAFTSQLA